MAGERLGSAVAVRSAVSPGGRVSFGGSKPGFESVRPVNLNTFTSFSLRVNNRIEAVPFVQFEPLRPRQIDSLRTRLGEIPPVKNKPAVSFFGPVRNAIPERGGDFGQPNVVQETVRFAQPKRVVQESPAEVNQPLKINSRVGEKAVFIKPEVSVKLQTVEAQRASGIDLMRLAAQSRLISGRVRILRSQSIPMVSPETEAVVSTQAGSAPASENGDSRPVSNAGALKAEIKRNVNQTKTRRVVRELRKEATEQENRRKRFVERDLMMNVLRLKTLVKGYEELRAENPEGEVDGMAVARKSFIGTSRELRSLLLEQRGYKDRQDGSQRRMELFLGSVRAVNKEQLKEIVNGNTAVKETDEKPRDPASIEDLRKVVRRPEDLNQSSEEVEREEIIGQTRNERVVAVENKQAEESQIFDERKIDREIEDVKEVSALGVEETSRPIEMFDDNMASVLGNLYPRLQRRELVF